MKDVIDIQDNEDGGSSRVDGNAPPERKQKLKVSETVIDIY